MKLKLFYAITGILLFLVTLVLAAGRSTMWESLVTLVLTMVFVALAIRYDAQPRTMTLAERESQFDRLDGES